MAPVLRSPASLGARRPCGRLRVACSAESPRGSADAWVTQWRSRQASGEPAPAPRAVFAGRDPRSFRYVFAGGLSASSCAFTALVVRDALEPRGASLSVVSPLPAGEPWTLSAALRAFEAELAALPGDAPMRLIGASTGGLLAALFAERQPEAVDSLFLLAPTFDLAACLQRAAGGPEGLDAWRRLGTARLEGVPLAFGSLADAATHSSLPFVRCRSYVAHGNEDCFADLNESLAWVRQASVDMRPRGMPLDKVQERRLLELSDDHALAASVPSLAAKLLEWHGLFGLQPEDSSLRGELLEGEKAAALKAAAQGHGVNFAVYKDWLRSQGLDPDDMA